MTTATAVSLLVYLKGIARGLGGLPSVHSQLEVADPGNPQTILILGSDQRPTDESARSDTTILLRVALGADHGDVDPARPEGEHPRPRDRQVQRRLLLRGAEAGPEGRQAAHRPGQHQPRRQRRLQRLRRRRQRDRLRVRRRRPSLLPLEPRAGGLRAVRGNRRRGRLPADVRLQRAPIRPLSPRGQRPGAGGAPAGVPAGGAPAAAGREDRQGPQRADRHPEEVRDLGHRGRDRPGQPWKAVHRRQRRPGGPGPLPRQPGRAERVLRHRLRVGDPGGREAVRGRVRATPGRGGTRGRRLEGEASEEAGRQAGAGASAAGRLVGDWASSSRRGWPARRRRAASRCSTSRSSTPPSWRRTRA